MYSSCCHGLSLAVVVDESVFQRLTVDVWELHPAGQGCEVLLAGHGEYPQGSVGLNQELFAKLHDHLGHRDL